MDAETLRAALLVRAADFWPRCDVREADECWIWLRSFNDRSYGRVTYRIDGEHVHVPAHRAAYMIAVGDLPDELTIDHTCGHPPCVNPAHLEPVTQAENMRRKWRERVGVNVMERKNPSGSIAYRVRWREFPAGLRVQRSRTFPSRGAAEAFAQIVPDLIRRDGFAA